MTPENETITIPLEHYRAIVTQNARMDTALRTIQRMSICLFGAGPREVQSAVKAGLEGRG